MPRKKQRKLPPSSPEEVDIYAPEKLDRDSLTVIDKLKVCAAFLPEKEVHHRLVLSLDFSKLLIIRAHLSTRIRLLGGLVVSATRVRQFQNAGYSVVTDPKFKAKFLVLLSIEEVNQLLSSPTSTSL